MWKSVKLKIENLIIKVKISHGFYKTYFGGTFAFERRFPLLIIEDIKSTKWVKYYLYILIFWYFYCNFAEQTPC